MLHNDADSLQYNTENVSVDSSKFSSQSIGESINSISGCTLPSFTDSSTISKHSGLVTCQSDRPQYTWRIDLIKTQPFWQGWFSGLSKLFLSIPEPKLLLLADADRLDKDLTIGQMQARHGVSLHTQSNALYTTRSRRLFSRLMNVRYVEELEAKLPGPIYLLVKWWFKIRPFKVELADLHRRVLRNKEGFDVRPLIFVINFNVKRCYIII
ncbi:uncharacterized protein DC041_0007335 [Schistosoma bovis]|uniref:Uncharacterized protein n=1 Tax=Schistosoma bovis TaxID=6184 RepID=A0A430QUR5_SCHBO|nr:uncharacterized protein DC041_0007335 [Schistosoma bovis]